MTPTPAQVEACRVACFDQSRVARWWWMNMPGPERIEYTEKWLAGLAYRAGKPRTTNQEVQELFGNDLYLPGGP